MKNVLLLLLSLSIWGARAQQTQPLLLSLEEAMQHAAGNSYGVLDKELEYEKAKQTINETRAMGLPQITVGFDHLWNPQLAQQPVPAEFFGGPKGSFAYVTFGVEHQNTASISLNQLIFDASYFVALKAARVVREDASLKLEKSKIDARTNAAKAYYAVLISGENVKLMQDNLSSLEKNLFEVQQLYNNGFVEEQDVDQLQLLVNNLKNQLNQAKRQEEVSLLLLKFYLGVEQERTLELTDDLETLLINDSYKIAAEENLKLENHIDYRSLLAQEKGARLQVTYDKMTFVPKIRGFINHNQVNFNQNFSETFNFNTFWIPSTAIGVGLSWDLFNGGARWAVLNKSQLDLERIMIAKELTENNLKVNYLQSRSNYMSALDDYQSQLRSVEISERIRNKTRIKYQEGMASSLDLTQAENQYLEAQGNYIQSLLNLLNSKEELETALGL